MTGATASTRISIGVSTLMTAFLVTTSMGGAGGITDATTSGFTTLALDCICTGICAGGAGNILLLRLCMFEVEAAVGRIILLNPPNEAREEGPARCMFICCARDSSFLATNCSATVLATPPPRLRNAAAAVGLSATENARNTVGVNAARIGATAAVIGACGVLSLQTRLARS